MEKKISPARIGARFGLAAGLLYVGLVYILYLVNPELVVSFWVFCGLGIIIFLKIWAVHHLLKVKKHIEFKEGLQAAFMVSVVSLLIWTVFMNLLIAVIDPSLIQTRKDLAIKETVKRMELDQRTPVEIKEEVKNIEQLDFAPSFSSAALQYCVILFVGFVYAAMIAWLYRYLSLRNNPHLSFSSN